MTERVLFGAGAGVQQQQQQQGAALQGVAEAAPERLSNLAQFQEWHREVTAAAAEAAGGGSPPPEGAADVGACCGLAPEQRGALAAVDLDALRSFQLDVLAAPSSALVPLVVAIFLDMDAAYVPLPSLPPGAGEERQPGLVSVAVLWAFVEEVRMA